MIIGRKKTKARYAPSTPWNTRLHRELPVAEENEVPQDSLDESYWTPSVGHDLPDACRPYTSASFTSDKQELFLGLDVDAPMQVPCHRGLLRGNLTFLRAEVQTARAQPQPSTKEANSLQLQLGQQLDRGDNRARLDLSPTIWSLAAKMGSGDQRPLSQELGLDASVGMTNHTLKLEGETAEGSVASQCECQVFDPMKAPGVTKHKIIKRKLQFIQGQLACRFPAFKLRAQRYQVPQEIGEEIPHVNEILP
ncbi:neuroblastoma breakpoint family member 6-like isoform X7 [Canis lupus familiaris]|uniref:neuroblastoma breakpoint family member 6-like isoform X7 n=2 Tax=Canis lupus familiaris TaxID=9615 RepID=UPI0018F67C89|nr:neuroblastoma breakpoint family member 6-like isoform X7 [Canis lupus familiaris]XP_038417888.1 neuroblastoma breakpoint family member 6-like isoform X7 [Canis lupus familiaris]XP_038417889.1 neuroblastoma breakpoint family member 6-like isoform X7 [Canis lupus familiaris]XP_038417890.1 neuroblastoma breakpoint family member 6-like isoform X7 [Canis lupus familiaris]